MANRPATEIRLGHLKAAIWANETSVGIRHSVTFKRLYQKDEQWEETDAFNRDDLLLLGKLADQVHTWIVEQSREQTATRGHANGKRNGEPAASRY